MPLIRFGTIPCKIGLFTALWPQKWTPPAGAPPRGGGLGSHCSQELGLSALGSCGSQARPNTSNMHPNRRKPHPNPEKLTQTPAKVSPRRAVHWPGLTNATQTPEVGCARRARGRARPNLCWGRLLGAPARNTPVLRISTHFGRVWGHFQTLPSASKPRQTPPKPRQNHPNPSQRST